VTYLTSCTDVQQWGVGKCLRTVVLVGVVLGGIEAGLIFALRVSPERPHDLSLQTLTRVESARSFAHLAFHAHGRPLRDVAGTRRRTTLPRHLPNPYRPRLSFIFVGIDALGDLTSLLSLGQSSPIHTAQSLQLTRVSLPREVRRSRCGYLRDGTGDVDRDHDLWCGLAGERSTSTVIGPDPLGRPAFG
jgi:hypothetical protein